MELNKTFDFQSAEEKWYKHWMTKGYFSSKPDERPPYTIVMPPPNVTGVLHMGHALNNSVQDILIRRAKAKGYNTCWVPGTDHASIATEAKVVAMLKEQGVDKNDLDREVFLKHAWDWKEKYGGIILQQLKKLGCALDWDRTNFTMDDHYYNAVIDVFIQLYEKGIIYRDVKMINWDPQAKTSLSDEEVIHKSAQSKLYYVKYQVEGTNEYIVVATVRPETILGDTAICVHPEDERYAHLKGKRCIVPIVNRSVPIIFDDYIDTSFGTGALKVTPAHDVNDYNLSLKHQLEIVDILNADGTLAANTLHYAGQDRFEARKSIVVELESLGLIDQIEDYTNQVGYSERTNAVVEPRLSMQWWVSMKKLAEPALQVVLNNDIEFVPSKFKNLYKYWMENIKDWNISRQLWWGQRIPAWYDDQGKFVVAKDLNAAIEKYKAQFGTTVTTLKQDEDCLDTWFSSWLWPMEVFGWNEHKTNNEELNYYYPTTTLVTAPEIIFFWVARMIMAGMEFKQQIPFKKVYFTGVVRDKKGKKMSKSLGNSPDLLKLIEDFGADVVRFSVMISSPAGNDLLYDEATLEQGRNFTNKIWNALKLVKIWEGNLEDRALNAAESVAIEWMEQRIVAASLELEQLMEQFRLSVGLKLVYSLIWDDFCSWFLEWAKPQFGTQMSQLAHQKVLDLFEQLMHLLHPYMPYITEEIYHLLKNRADGDDLMSKLLNLKPTVNETVIADGKRLQQLITDVRDMRVKQSLKNKELITLHVETKEPSFYERVLALLEKQVNAKAVHINAGNIESVGLPFISGPDKLRMEMDKVVDNSSQIAEIEKEISYLEGFLGSLDKKLSNEKFMANAKPEVIANEQKKKSDALLKIENLKMLLDTLK